VIEKQVGASVVIYTRSVEIEVTMGAHVKIWMRKWREFLVTFMLETKNMWHILLEPMCIFNDIFNSNFFESS
jgi:hypothetical protein